MPHYNTSQINGHLGKMWLSSSGSMSPPAKDYYDSEAINGGTVEEPSWRNSLLHVSRKSTHDSPEHCFVLVQELVQESFDGPFFIV